MLRVGAFSPRRTAIAAAVVAVVGLLVWQVATAHGGTPDPTEDRASATAR